MPNKKKRVYKKALKKTRKNTTVDPIMKKAASRTQDPVRSGSAGSGKVSKETGTGIMRAELQSNYSTRAKKKLQTAKKSIKKGVDGLLGYKGGGKMKMKYNDGGRVQHD